MHHLDDENILVALDIQMKFKVLVLTYGPLNSPACLRLVDPQRYPGTQGRFEEPVPPKLNTHKRKCRYILVINVMKKYR